MDDSRTDSAVPSDTDVPPCGDDPRGGILRWPLRGLSLTAMLLSGFLAWISLTHDVALAGCGGVAFFDCDTVLGSRWATWFGLPVSLPAVAVYAGILTGSILIGPRRSPVRRARAWQALILLGVLAAGAGLWFAGLSFFGGEPWCPLCLVIHACGLAVAGLVLVGGPISRSHAEQHWFDALGTAAGFRQAVPRVAIAPTAAAKLGLAGLVGVAALALGQWLIPPPPSHRIVEPAEVALAGTERTAFSPDLSLPTKTPSEEASDPAHVDGAPAPPPDDALGSAANDIAESGATPFDGGAASAVGPEPAGPGEPVEEPSPDAVIAPADPPSPDQLPPYQQIRVLNGKVTLNTDQYPVLGHPGAEHVVVDLFDYTCKDCRELHRQLAGARQRYGHRLAVMLAPVPMNTACNDFIDHDHPDHHLACHYAKLALAVWFLKPEKFQEFHDWLLEPDELPDWQQAVDHAAELVGGKDVLAPAFTGEEVQQKVRGATRLYRWSGGGRIPRLLIGSGVLVGGTRSTDGLCRILEGRLAIRPVK
jgi:uncharacterized membrane protein/protein-disulfide isomerase